MAVSHRHVVIDAHDLRGGPVLEPGARWPVLSELERKIVIGPADDARVSICFMPSPNDKIVTNRVHLDLNPGPEASGGEREAEI